MTVTIRRLVADTRLGLRVVLGHEGLDQPVRWAVVSELPDPAPWLDGAELLLTSGMWLREEREPARAAETWAGRLAEAGARAIGFGLDPWFGEVPPEIINAARRWGLTLIEIPSRTPFVAIDRAVAELNAAEARREAEQGRRVQQRLAEAGRSGRRGVAERLARELHGWVALLDAGHEVALRVPAGAGPDDAVLGDLARRGDQAGRQALHDEIDGMAVTAVPLGLARERRGTLVVGSPTVEERPVWASSVVGTAAALLTVLDRGGEHELRGVVGGLLLEGDVRSAERVAAVSDIPLPSRFVAVALVGQGRRRAATRLVAAGGWLANEGDTESLVLVTPDFGDERLLVLLEGGRAGLSVPRAPEQVETAAREARQAAQLTGAGRTVVRYADTAAMELDRLLASPSAERFAETLLAPVTEAPDSGELIDAARHWVAANYHWDPAASEAGVHRETLRERMRRLAGLTGLNLDQPTDRLALSLALTVSRPH
ncbi:PucR family transcriptional regulator [Spongiactinospora sp. TRM90649]|uniref:PucR family transcriptional regulator n=1 Tax=Spongiactinospora sp. TRM90649 TaxID=3031114 RepID=UPI0023F7735C|nr:PucR family transcriptional regulator [Spongiactinospora sp. TRM90649]MDF5753671.1 PucR family transcriptional regulator [Spongiactinospora sp. TRM90649]